MQLYPLRSLAWPIATMVAAALVVVLAMQKRALEGRVGELVSRIRDPYPGFVVPEANAVTLEGDTVILGLPDSGSVQLLFLFKPGCKPCDQSLPAWNALHSSLVDRPQIEVLGVSLDGAEATRRHAADRALAFRTVSLPDRRMQSLWRATWLPQTQVVDWLGHVLYARLGKLATPASIDSVRMAALTHGSRAGQTDADGKTATTANVERGEARR